MFSQQKRKQRHITRLPQFLSFSQVLTQTAISFVWFLTFQKGFVDWKHVPFLPFFLPSLPNLLSFLVSFHLSYSEPAVFGVFFRPYCRPFILPLCTPLPCLSVTEPRRKWNISGAKTVSVMGGKCERRSEFDRKLCLDRKEEVLAGRETVAQTASTMRDELQHFQRGKSRAVSLSLARCLLSN